MKIQPSDLEKRAIRRLDILQAEAVVPFGEHGQCYGVLLLGQRVDHQAFSAQELSSLAKLAQSLTHLVPQVATVGIVK